MLNSVQPFWALRQADGLDDMDNSNNYQLKRLQAELRKLEKRDDLSSIHKEKIYKFLELINALGRSPATKRNIVWALTILGKILGKPFEEANYEDIVKVVGTIEEKYQSRKSKKALKSTLKRFYQWLRQSQDYPPEVAWVKLDYGADNITKVKPEDLLTDEEVEALANVALIYMLRESGCRVGELLNLKIKNIKFDNKGVILHIPESKTGRRLYVWGAIDAKLKEIVYLYVSMYRNSMIASYVIKKTLQYCINKPIFLIDGAPWLKDALTRLGLDWMHVTFGYRNAVERLFRYLKERTKIFYNNNCKSIGNAVNSYSLLMRMFEFYYTMLR